MPARTTAAFALILVASCGGPQVESARPPPPFTVTEIILRTTRDTFSAAELALASDDRSPTRDFSSENRWRTSITREQTTVRIDVEPENLGSTVTVTAETSSALGTTEALQLLATGTLDHMRDILFTGRLENPIPRAYAGAKNSASQDFAKDLPLLYETARKSLASIGYKFDKTSYAGPSGWWIRARGPFGIHIDFIRRDDRSAVTITAYWTGTKDPKMTDAQVLDQLAVAAKNLLDDIARRAGEK